MARLTDDASAARVSDLVALLDAGEAMDSAKVAERYGIHPVSGWRWLRKAHAARRARALSSPARHLLGSAVRGALTARELRAQQGASHER